MRLARKDQLKSLLKDTVILMCKSVNFEQDLRVEGLVGVTIDNKEVILIGFNELLCGDEDGKDTDQMDMTKKSIESVNEVKTNNNQPTPKIGRRRNTPQSHLQPKVKKEPVEKEDETTDVVICKDSKRKESKNATGNDDDLIYVGKEYFSLVTGVKQELPNTSVELAMSNVRKRSKIDQLYSAVCRKRPNVQVNCNDGVARSSGKQGYRAVKKRPACKQKLVSKTTKSTGQVTSSSTEIVKPQSKAGSPKGKKQHAGRCQSRVAPTSVALAKFKPAQFSSEQGNSETVTNARQITHRSGSGNLQSLTSTSKCNITPTQVIYVKSVSKKSPIGFSAVSTPAANNQVVAGNDTKMFISMSALDSNNLTITKTALVNLGTPVSMHTAARMTDSSGPTPPATLCTGIDQVAQSSSVSQSTSDTLSTSVIKGKPLTTAADINQAIPAMVPKFINPESPGPKLVAVSESTSDLASTSVNQTTSSMVSTSVTEDLQEKKPQKEHRPKRSTQSNKLSVTCYLCGTTLSSSNSMKWHMKENHSMLKHFSCTHCSKSFVRQRSFLKHLQNHYDCKDK